MSKQKQKKPCEFEAMKLVTELLAEFSKEERDRILLAVDCKLDATPDRKRPGRKPKLLSVGVLGDQGSANGHLNLARDQIK